jgi:hypothetical protein
MTASDFSQVTVGVAGAGALIAPATQLVEGGGPSCLLYNTSAFTTVWVTQQNSYNSGDAGTPYVVPLAPGQTVVFDGTLDVFGVCPAGQSAVVNVYPSAINVTGTLNVTPLYPPAGTAFPIAVAAGASSTLVNMVDASAFNSYDLNAVAYCSGQGAAGAPLCAQWNLIWYDSPGSVNAVFQETWYTWLSNTSPTAKIAFGCGPMHGRYFSLQLVNYGTTGTIELTAASVYASVRNVVYSDWRQTNVGANQNTGSGLGFANNAAPASGYDNTLALANGAVAANASLYIPCDLYAGIGNYYFFTNEQSNGSSDIVSGAGLVNGGFSASALSPNVISSFGESLTNSFAQGFINLPRAPVYLTYVNGATAGNYQFALIGQQAI